jgi:hypothetical protein
LTQIKVLSYLSNKIDFKNLILCNVPKFSFQQIKIPFASTIYFFLKVLELLIFSKAKKPPSPLFMLLSFPISSRILLHQMSFFVHFVLFSLPSLCPSISLSLLSSIWTQSLALAKQVLYCLSNTSSPFCSVYFGDKSLMNYCPSWPQTMILSISASLVGRIIGVSHKLTTDLFFELHNISIFLYLKIKGTANKN